MTSEIKDAICIVYEAPLVSFPAAWPHSMEVVVSSAPQQEEPEGDVGFQLKVSFPDKAVQRNARLAGKWGPSENTLSYFPFTPGESFKVRPVLPVGSV